MTLAQKQFLDEYSSGAMLVDAAERAGMRLISHGRPRGRYVYGLVGLDGKVFYVGKGVRGRWLQHFRERANRLGNHAKRAKARACGTSRRCLVVAEGLTEAEAFTLERQMIAALPGLTNLYPGQRGEQEQFQDAAREAIAELPTFHQFLAKRDRSIEDQIEYLSILIELDNIAANGWQNSAHLRRVNGGPTERLDGDGEWRPVSD